MKDTLADRLPPSLKRRLGTLALWPERTARRWWSERRGPKLRKVEHWLTTPGGYRVSVHVHEPADGEVRPALVLVPGRGRAGDVFCGERYTVSADDFAVRGVRVAHFDPLGRGQSWGHDDFGGLEGQEALRAVLDFLHTRRDVRPDHVGVASFSAGMVIAAPLLAREGRRLGTRFLLDWEGPARSSDFDPSLHFPPTAQAAFEQDPRRFWEIREPVQHVGALPCAYWRIQGEVDHTGTTAGRASALALVAAACKGGVPSVRLNDNPPDQRWAPDDPSVRWAPRSPAAQHSQIVRSLCEALEVPYE